VTAYTLLGGDQCLAGIYCLHLLEQSDFGSEYGGGMLL